MTTDMMKRLLIVLIRFYRRSISPLKSTKCPYHPTCSEYGLEAVEKFGAFRGSFLALWRIVRCNPFSHGGYDPVPEKFSDAFSRYVRRPEGK